MKKAGAVLSSTRQRSARAFVAIACAVGAGLILAIPVRAVTTLDVCAAGCTYATITEALDDIPNLVPDTVYEITLAAGT